jgi:hypothetical protein
LRFFSSLCGETPAGSAEDARVNRRYRLTPEAQANVDEISV